MDEWEVNNGSEWFINRGEVIAFGRYLIESTKVVTPDDLLLYFEKPWEYTSEYNSWKHETGRQDKQESLTSQV